MVFKMSAYEKTLKPKIKPIEHAFETTLNWIVNLDMISHLNTNTIVLNLSEYKQFVQNQMSIFYWYIILHVPIIYPFLCLERVNVFSVQNFEKALCKMATLMVHWRHQKFYDSRMCMAHRQVHHRQYPQNFSIH